MSQDPRFVPYIRVKHDGELGLELDASIGDIRIRIVDREVEIMLGILQRLLDIEDELVSMAEACFELDW